VSEVAVAGVQALSARPASGALGRDAHDRVHGAMGGVGARVVGAGGEVVSVQTVSISIAYYCVLSWLTHYDRIPQ
jgi:predicted kinase